MSHNDSVEFFQSGKPSAKFDKLGTTVSGTITEEPTMQQQTDPSGKPKVWEDSGEPMLQLVVHIQTGENDPDIEDDDGVRRLYIKGQMRTAVQQALRDANSKGLDVGGTIAVTYTHDGERSNPAFSPPKQYVAVYTPPKADQSGFFGTGNGQLQAQVVAAAPVSLPGGMTQAVWDSLPQAAKDALSGTPAPVEEAMPPGMTREVWNTLSQEARAALKGLVKQ